MATKKYTYKATGGLSLRGSAASSKTRERVAPVSGGIAFGGAAATRKNASRVYYATGGITLSGHAVSLYAHGASCGFCFYFAATDASLGRCHFYPPRPGRVTMPASVELLFPLTSTAGWCGQYKEKV